MALRPPRSGLSVARRLSEQARAANQAGQAATAPGSLAASMADALRGLADKLAQAAQEVAEPASPSAQIERRMGGKAASMVFGYTLRMGQDGVNAEPFGDLPTAKAGPQQAASEPVARQPITEIFVEDGWVTVVAELPGADPAQIICTPQGSALLIESLAGRRYRKALDLPMPVRPDGMTQSFANGILEVRLNRAELP